MKKSHLLLLFFLILISCSSDDAINATINGTVQRALDGNGIADQSVIVMTRKHTGSGLFSTIKELDRTEVITDVNGNFSAALINEVGAFITIVHQGDDDYSGTGIYTDYPINEPIIIEVDKFIKFKISVNNTNPIDGNDFINIDFFAGLINVKRTDIENFGIENTYHPEEQLPGGGTIGPWEETSWTGIDVKSIIYYSVPETAEHFKIRWIMKKNGIETDGFTDEIPHTIDQVNPFAFQY
ncbi:hypothetical protein [Aequorivita lipolytica]|uniref:Carboxypeptidase regulatory-like domain-containing protein n=1 Tax=Aequorivita lipolytica TaxID=153267 RepID=A0A5C6YQ10_9FLAO|nr:hypothetical protein [Aequorivita lipolytica]TXD69106.1 hypothetical protein ESV24_08660 [Aequorivita lipolytica]SRX51321.1 hypothetical protein AEQU2_01801 [Aequorivita lipolytica]